MNAGVFCKTVDRSNPQSRMYSQTTSIGGRLKFLGGNVTGKCTQLTIAITGVATILRMGYKTAPRAERTEKNFLVCIPNL